MGRSKKAPPPTTTMGSGSSSSTGNRIPPVATGTKKRAAAEVGGNPPSVATTAVTKDPPPPPFLHRLISLLQAYHEAIHEDKYVTLSILTTQLIDKHPLCQLLLLHSNATTANNSASTSTTATTTNLATDESSGGVAVQDQFVYWLYLASHCLEKLVQYNNSLLQSNAAATTDFDGSAPTTTSISAAWLSYTITQALLSMLPAKQERLNTSAARHLVGRALILVATAATEALSQLSSISSSSSSDNLSGTSGSGRNKSNNKDAAASNGSSIVVSASIQACVLALDSVTMVHSSPLTDSHEYWSQCVPSWRESIHAVWTDHSKTLQQYMLSSSHELDWTLEWTCCQLLSNSTSISSTTVIAPRAGIAAPGKRVSSRGSSHTATSARAGSTTASSAETTNILPAATLLQTMEALIHQDSSQHGVGLESRLALKRWTAASLTWYAPSGQEKLLAAADRLLQRDKKSTWVSVCERNVVIGLLPSRLEPTATLPIEDSMNEDSTIENNMCASMDESFESLVQSKKKKSKSPERQAAPNFVKVPVPDNVSFITLVCRLIRIVWEIGNNAGVRPPPSGGYDTYMKSLTGTVLKKNKKLCRADLRDVAMSVAYHLIQCHHDSLRENYGSKCDKCVINEDDDDVLRRRTLSSKSKMVPIDGVDHLLYMSLFSYYPFVHQAVVELSNAAAASAAGSSLTQLFRWSDRIEFASSAFIFSTQEQILDLRLTGYAMEKLVSCLSSKPSLSSGVTADAAVSSPTISSNSSAKKKKDVWKLDVPLPTPCFQQQKRVAKSVQSRKRKSHVDREEATFCTFAGVFDDRGKGGDGAALPELSFDEKLSLFIRATRGDSLLASHLIWIVEACYDTRTPRDPIAATSTDEINVDVRTEAGKRKTNDHSSGKSKKRRKQNVDVSSAESMACEGLPPLRYRAIKGVRASVATEALVAIYHFLRDPLVDSSLSRLQSSLREAVSLAHLDRIIALGEIVEEVLANSHAGIVSEKELSENATPPFSEEKSVLWKAHMNVFASIGNGTACEPLPHSVLGPLRQMVYERIAKESKRRSTTLSWPLCLRPSHRVLLIANFVSEPDNDLDSKLYDADRFVVNGFISELTAVLQDVSVLNDANGLSQSFSSFKECPLSLIDARVFLYSLARLPPSEQVSGLSTFLTAVDDGFINIKESEASVFANKNVSHFLARVVSLSINMYCTVKYGAQSRDALKKVLLNSLTSISRIDLRPTSNWYTSERCFMSVFSDWEESGLPPNFSTQKYVSKTSEASLDRLLEKAFVLGFKTATSDHCHLLFASWNAIGKDALWKEISWSIKPFTRLPDGVALLILQLRDEMCSVSAQVKKVHGGQVHSLPMSKIVDEKLSTQRVSDAELKSLLQTMIKKASKIVDAVLRKYKPSFSTQGHDIPSEVFALLEGCAVYITYAVSMFTKPSGNFYFATMEKVSTRHMNRTRGNSIDSDFLHSDTGSADSHDASVETVERLRAVCYYLGAAPAHPDWLDKDCQLLECVSLNEAAEAANEANICLTKLISVGWSQCQFLQHSAIKATIAPGQDIRVAALVSKICQLQRFDVSMSSFLDYPTCNFQLEMAELCGLQPTFNHVLITDSAAKKRKIVNTTWCSRAAQRIVGQYHDVIRTKLATDASNAELRLSGEWEVLLSRMLSSSCLRVESGGENSAFRNKADFLIASSNQWHGVCFGALEALVPTVALLRFGLTTIGRAPHPLAVFMTTPENFETRRGSLVEPVSSDVVVPIAIRESLTSTLAMVALCPPAPICSAIATHLFIDTASFATLQGLVVVSTALEALSELNDVLVTEDRKFLMATSLMIDQAAAVLAAFGTGGAEKLTILHACLSHRSNLSSIRFDTFFSKQINPFVALSTAAVDNDTILSRNLWSREGSSGRFVRCLSSFVLNGSLCTRSKTRSFFAHAISSVIAKELSGDLSVSNRQCEVQSMFIESFNDVREGSIGDLVREVCESDSILEKRMDPFTSISSYPLNEKLSTLFALLLATGENCVSFKHTELVANTLEEMYNCWSVSALRQRKYVLNLTLLCSIRCGRVLKLGDKLFSDLQQKTLTEHMTGCFIENLRMFIELMAELHRLLLQEQVSSETSLRSKANSISLLPTSCSYVTKKDFHEQHWYNCYSCGLTNDKGCCSLCAVVCHQNHDIAYARYSSFFCDCGSAADSPESGSSINCQCLGLHTQDKFLTQREREVFDTLVSGDRNGMPFLSVRFCSLSVKLLYRNQGIFSVNNLIEKGRESSWVQFLFEFTKNAFERCKSQNTADNEEVSTQTITRSYNVLRSSMSEVAHNSFQLERLTHESFTKLGETLSGTFKVGTLDRKSRNFIARQVIDADCRGRIAIAESCDVVFFSGLPVVNECGAEGKFDGSLARSSMCALCSVSFGFQVLGVKFARECENVIVAWGYQEAKVCFMDISLTVVRDFVTLDLNVSAEDFSNNILGCHWLVGAGSCLIIGSSHGLKVFEVSTRADSISPAVVIPTSYQIRDFVVARVSDSESRSSVESQVKIWKTILLLENGSIREGILKQDEKGTISVNSPLNPCQILSVTRSTFVMDPFAEEVSSELESIVFLEKSKIVLYISSTLGVWAVILNEKGEQKESFKFLPSNFEFLSEEKNEIHIVTGPLSQFHELGIVQRDLGFFYRLSCTGVTSTGDHVCFCLEFNSSGAFIREMPKLNRSWSDPIHSFQGFAVFTAPCVFDDSDPYNLTRDRLFVERVVVCALTSNGSLHFYAEEKAAPTRAALGSSSRFDVTMLSYSSEMKFSEAPLLNRTPQLLSIENMKNISTSSNVVFAASGLGSSDCIRRKLIEEPDNFLMSKSKDGFTLSIKILDKLDKTVADSSTYSNSLTEDVDFSVTAVRLLVGSILQANIPRQLKIMGRTHSLTSGSKRWYTFYLTAQEVALSVRNGFISIVVGQCFDSSICPALEAIELYALERKLIERWLPSTLHSSISTMGHCGRKVVAHNTRETFRVSLMALASSNGLLRSLKLHGEEKMFLTQIIVNSTLNDQDPEVEEATIRLLTSMIRDEETRQAFYDMSVLNGCSDFLLKCKYTLDEVRLMKNPSQFHPVWLALIPSIRNCLQTAARIARQRPFNYLQAADASIVEYASNCINECFKESLVNDDLVSDLVELSLLETAVANGTPRGNFGSFSGLMGLLANPNQAVVSQASLSICRFCQVCDLFNSPAITVKYICDSCLLFINDSRFTLLDDDHAFDLCPECYHIATGLVIDENCRDSDSVIINGKPVGDKVQLTCGEVQVLQPVAIQKYLTDGDSGSDAKGNPDKLELFNDFMDCLCTGIAGLLGDELREKPLLPSSFLWLSVDLVRHSLIRGRKTARAKRLAEAIAFRLCSKLEALPKGANLSDDCIVLFEALMCLFAPDRSVRDFFFGTRSDFVDVEHDANTEVVCEVHKARARLRRFTEGPDKDRCFLSCSKTANNCCTFFVWHDQLDTLSGSAQSNVSLFSDSIAMFVWELFASPLTDTGSSMNSILISFVEQIWNQNQSLCEKRQTLSAALRSEVKSIGCDLQKIYADGVVCSLARLADDAILDNMICHDQKSKLPQAGSVAFDCDTLAVEKCLELISLVASPDAQRTHEWFPILCRIMLSDKAQSSPYDTLRVLAKRSIKHLCGRDSGLSYAVRDHFVFTFHCDRLLTCANDMFKTCAMLNEKARQCGLEWTTGNPLTFRRLTMGHFVGTEFLISEDISNFQVNERLSKLLTQLWTEASKRPRGWNRFCGLSTFSASSSSKESDLDAPPILYILAVACAASPANQLIAIRLLNLALSFPNESKESSLKCEEPSKLNEINNTNELVCSHSVLVPGRLSSLYSNTLKPEDILISTISELHNFVMRFVYRGPSTEIRVLSCSVAKRLCQEFDTKSLGVLIERLMRNSFCLVGRTGKQSAEFFSFLQTAVKLAGSSVVDVTRFTGVVQTSLKNQILAMRHDRANCEFMQLEITASTGVQKKRFDFAACDSCRFNESRYKESRPDKSTFASTSDLRALSSTRSNPDHADLPKTKWLNQQVSPFSRGRLDSSRDSCTSSEFCLFFSLKHRCVVSTIHVEVENPRRLVKTIKVFSSSRPVDDASLLKSPEFVNNWQPCGVLTLTRGCARDSLTLPTPVVAANIKIEFVDFYERPGGSKAADGTLIVHCPRCTRVVTNAHGVCANCGEVAFQCRKCRHINYDRLDAFLCVECGFCSSGTFQFELTSAVATNGIAILSDRDYSRSLQRYGTAASLHQDLKAALKQKLIDLVRGRKKGQSDNEEDQDLDLFPSLRRAFQGNLSLEPHETEEDHDHTKLTLNHLGKPGSMVKAIARSADAVSTNNPLFQYRTDRRRNLSGSSRTDGFLGQFGIRDPEGDDTVSVIGGLLDGSSALSRFANLDPGDPLSRLLASVQSRRDRRNTGAAEATATLSALGTSQNRCSQKDTLEVCDRLYGMMREAEREMYELHRRCAAWRQLDMGSLIEDGTTGTQETAPSFEPSHCCVCAVTMTMHLLSLWLCLFELKPDAVELNEEFISLLLNGDPASSLKNITETKHNAIKDIAVYSTQGRPLVLEALRLRLIYLHDPSVAEILGQIMQSLRDDSEAAAPFLALAEEALESGLS